MALRSGNRFNALRIKAPAQIEPIYCFSGFNLNSDKKSAFSIAFGTPFLPLLNNTASAEFASDNAP
ncbi:hypothetical protein N0398_01535 [Providencia rettgeri]|nr:hypothetical protein [Providencia rettgeri]